MRLGNWPIVLLVILALTLTGCVRPSGGEIAAEVTMIDSTFRPGEVMIAVGETVRWTNDDSMPHTVTAEDGEFRSGNMDEGDTFEHTFTEEGSYDYSCDYHPGMNAEILVD